MDGSSSSPRGSEVRIGHSLNKDEEAFVARRRNTVLQCLQRLQIYRDDEANFVGGGQRAMPGVPNIALLGSGGGQRAMVGLLGSLVQLDKAGLLDCILYLSGVSGSTWCMASLYQEPDWSTKLDTMKDKIIKRLSGPVVSFTEAFKKLEKYYNKHFFSLTDVWAVLTVTEYVKEINEHTLTEEWNHDSKDPFPIYTLIDKQCKQQGHGDPWFEISPYEAGYSVTGAFVDTCNFGSQFDNGSKKNHQDGLDMLYLQALCGSALAESEDIKKFNWQQIKDFGKCLGTNNEVGHNSSAVDKQCQVLTDLANMNLCVLNGDDPSDLDQSIRTTLNDLSGGKDKKDLPMEKLDLTNVEPYNNNVLRWLRAFSGSVSDSGSTASSNLMRNIKWLQIRYSIYQSMNDWNWGKNYNFLYNITDKTVPSAVLESETRDYEDAGLLLNSPYFSVLRKERDIDLIISLDFSDGDPFVTVREAAEMCKKLNIPFPEVNIPTEDVKKPKDFYVYKGQNAPSVIHIPLFNVVNCGDEVEAWRCKYGTFQGAYSAEMITDLMEVAGKNISNNKEKLLEQIRLVSITK